MSPEIRLAQMLGARFCHDLGGPAGAVSAALSMLDAGEEAAAVAREGAEIMLGRVRLWRALFGGTGDMAVPALAELLEGQVAGGRARVVADGVPAVPEIPAPQVPLVLAAGLLAGEALPRGGTVRLGGDPSREMAVLPEGTGASWPSMLATALSGATDATFGPREALAFYLTTLAPAVGARASLLLGPGEAPGPLLIEWGAAPKGASAA